jgi:4'-phosphopantetheinyl transferase EntD
MMAEDGRQPQRRGAEPRALIEAIVPAPAIAVDTRADFPDAPLFPGESEIVARAVQARQREFATARTCARRALAMMNAPPTAILRGPKGEPQWPAGVVGSITHCRGYRGAVVARSSQIATIGIDAEPNEPLPDGVLSSIGLPQELNWVDQLLATAPEVQWDRLLFCMKEAVYKAWYPLAKRWLDFDAASITVDRTAGTFTARISAAGPEVRNQVLNACSGRWLVRDGIVLAAIVLPERTFPGQRTVGRVAGTRPGVGR